MDSQSSTSAQEAQAKFRQELELFMYQKLNMGQPAVGHVTNLIFKEHEKMKDNSNLEDLNDFVRTYHISDHQWQPSSSLIKLITLIIFKMATIRPFNMFDVLKFNNINLDCLTETFYTSFYT